MQLNDYQEEVVRDFAGVAVSSNRDEKLLSARMALVLALGELNQVIANYVASGDAVEYEAKFFNTLCDVLHNSALAADGLGTNLEAIAQYGLDRARRGQTNTTISKH